MKWMGGEEDDVLLVLVGKGVVFDMGGILFKFVGGMEDMIMDMGGVGVVVGVMCVLVLCKVMVNVVGFVGFVENMLFGNVICSGDVVILMKGDIIEVINIDVEGCLVLCDVMYYV